MRKVIVFGLLVFITGGFCIGCTKDQELSHSQDQELSHSQGQELSHSFEMRYVSDDPGANGETDFKGETAVFDTEARVAFLSRYADYASRFFNDSNLDKEVVTDAEVSEALSRIKPQPLPNVRKRIPLTEWKWLGYGKDTGERDKNRATWMSKPGTAVKDGHFVFIDKCVLIQKIPAQTWRCSFQWRAKVSQTDKRVHFGLSEDIGLAAGVEFGNNGHFIAFNGMTKVELDPYQKDRWYSFKIETDITPEKHCYYNLYIDGNCVVDYARMISEHIKCIVSFDVDGVNGTMIDDIWGVGYTPTDDVRHPYTIETFLDEDFDETPSIDGWVSPEYDDSLWETAELPYAYGSERFAGEDLYFRKTIHVGEFERAFLNIETLDPRGEVWINGQAAAVLPNRHPAVIDISRYLVKNAQNTFAVKVHYFNIEEYGNTMMGHTPLDFNIGWFAGRMSLDLTSESHISDVFLYTKKIGNGANLAVRILAENTAPLSFRGNVAVRLYPWFSEESSRIAAQAEFPVVIGNGVKEINGELHVEKPALWTDEKPHMYRVEVVLSNETGEPVDDYVFTTGIRTVGQEGGTFRLNGKPDMLNGAQTFGFRSPIEKLVTWQRSCPVEWIMKELLMIKRMDGNLLRIHVHAWNNTAKNINDPRIAELADQLGIMIIWACTSWIRTAPGWGLIDFEGLPKYIRQVYNHPSIVMWEASNHPNSFKKRDYTESNLFVTKVYDTIYPLDPSRLISTTSFIWQLHYGNDTGTIDYQGNPMVPAPAWTAPMVTRGNQDSFTGYGKEWSVIRTQPTEYYKNHLHSPDRAYFNFEHEESIGQPNWSLVKGKPWYKLQSYEWHYDEGSIGRKLTTGEWRESQAWQAFSAYESMKKQRLIDYDGFSWCCLHGGPNTATYKKPLIDYHGHPKLAWYTNKMIFQHVLAGSGDVDAVYGPGDAISPVIMNLGHARTVNLTITVKTLENKTVDSTTYERVSLKGGRTVTEISDFKPDFPSTGYYAIEYRVTEAE